MSTDAAQPTPDDLAREAASRAVYTAMLDMARAAGAGVAMKPAWPGAKAATVPVIDPPAGIRFAVMLRDRAGNEVRGQIRGARTAGLTWRQVGEALDLASAAEESGISLAEAAFDYAVDAEHAGRFETLTFSWACPACGGFVTEREPCGGHPEDNEPGHKDGCTRLAALVAEYDARWENDGA